MTDDSGQRAGGFRSWAATVWPAGDKVLCRCYFYASTSLPCRLRRERTKRLVLLVTSFTSSLRGPAETFVFFLSLGTSTKRFLLLERSSRSQTIFSKSNYSVFYFYSFLSLSQLSFTLTKHRAENYEVIVARRIVRRKNERTFLRFLAKDILLERSNTSYGRYEILWSYDINI